MENECQYKEALFFAYIYTILEIHVFIDQNPMFRTKNKSEERVAGTDGNHDEKSYSLEALQRESKKKKTLHEVTTKNFKRTPKGLIFTKDAKDIFCVVLLCLDKKGELTKADSKRKLFVGKETLGVGDETYFTFMVKTCIEAMENLKIDIEMDFTTVSIFYSIKPEMSMQLLKLFSASKLLHTPNDRTRSEPGDKSLLQPTPKGVAILTKYVQDMGIRNIPEILYSNLNSAKLFSFERSAATDRIIYNEYLIKLIFMKMFGDHPNIWSPKMDNDKLPPLKELLVRTCDVFSFDDFDFSDTNFQKDFIDNTQQFGNENRFIDKSALFDNVNDDLLDHINRVSPLSHRFFTNPDSDSHVQYYSTGSGLRVFFNKLFATSKVQSKVIVFSFSTKAIVQWLMDCTDLVYYKEAVIVASLFYKTGLIIPITLSPSLSSKTKFRFGKKYLYTFSKLGCSCLGWNTEHIVKLYPDWANYQSVDVDVGQEDSKHFKKDELVSVKSLENNVKHDVFPALIEDESVNPLGKEIYPGTILSCILNDPGKRFLFKAHLDKEFCSENFCAYQEIKKFLKKMHMLDNLMKHRMSIKPPDENDCKYTSIHAASEYRLIKEADACLSIIYQIFCTYIATGSPRVLNIDYTLRSSISLVILGSNSPISSKFEESFGDKGFYEHSPDMPVFGETASNEQPFQTHTDTFQCDQILNTDKIIKTDFRRIEKPKIPEIIKNKSTSNRSNGPENLNLLQPLENKVSTDTLIKQSFSILTKLNPLFEEVNQKLYKIMETDSLPKFLSNDNM